MIVNTVSEIVLAHERQRACHGNRNVQPGHALKVEGDGIRTIRSIGHIRSAPGFSISILREDQRDLSSYFAGGWAPDAPPPPFSFMTWEGGPLLEGCIAALGCRTHGIHEGGDHWIVVGEVVATYRAEDAGEPLVFFSGKYVGLQVYPVAVSR